MMALTPLPVRYRKGQFAKVKEKWADFEVIFEGLNSG